MGNCLNICLSPAEKAKVLPFNDGEKEFTASKPLKKVTRGGSHHGYELVHCSLLHSTLPPNPKLEPHGHSISLKIIKKESCQGRNIKILVTKQQLELLLGDAKMFRSVKRATRSSRTCKQRVRKWRPSLSAIPEVPDL